MNLTQAIDGFLLFKAAQGLRPKTLKLYRAHLAQLVEFHGDGPLATLKTQSVADFLTFLRTEYRPKRWNGDDAPLSSQSIYNAWTALKSFTNWTHNNLGVPDIMTGLVPRPRVQNAEQTPFTQEEVSKLLKAVKPQRGARATSGLYYLTDLRDKALILFLLDTGIRAGELARLTIADVHLQSGQVRIAEGKGGKARRVWLGQQSRAPLWRYLQERKDGGDPAAPLFTAAGGRPLTHSALRKRLLLIGNRVGVPDARPHRFRYTFAIQYLRNGGDVFTLQSLLGHSTMTMVQHYLKLAQVDVENAHRRASPVDNWLK